MADPRLAPAPFFAGDGKIVFRDHPYREPGAGELLLAPRANAICGTDRGLWLRGAGHVPRHETAAEVLAAGPEVTTPVGTRGVVFLMDYCGRCRSCRLGATNQCQAKRADMGIADDGGFGPYEIVHETNFFPVDDGIDFADATMLLDVMGTSRHAITRAQSIRPDIESVYVAGAGPIGIGILIMVKLMLGPDVAVQISDVSSWRREFAASFGGQPVDATDETRLRGLPVVDVAFDATGKEVARRAALDHLGPRGALVCVGHGEGLSLGVSGDLIAPEHAVLGSEYFRFDDLPANLELLRHHRDFITRVITHRLPVTELAAAFELFLTGETGKVVVTQDAPAESGRS